MSAQLATAPLWGHALGVRVRVESDRLCRGLPLRGEVGVVVSEVWFDDPQRGGAGGCWQVVQLPGLGDGRDDRTPLLRVEQLTVASS